jgi:hypothetical protein
MSEAARTSVPSSQKGRRRRRLERELRALYAMRGHMGARDITYAILSIGGIALLCLLVAAKLHWLAGSALLSIGGALAAGVAVWMIGRRWFTLAWLIVIALVIIVFEGAAGDLPGLPGEDTQVRKEDRRAKLERAIAKREALLKAMGGTAS